MREIQLTICLFLGFACCSFGQLPINHHGATAFSSTDYLGAREHVETGSSNPFIIQSLKIWPGYAAKLYSSIDGRYQYFSTSITEIDPNDEFDILEVRAGGYDEAIPSVSGPFYCLVKGGASVKMTAYLEAGIHDVEEELGGDIASIDCATGYDCVQSGPHNIEVNALQYTRAYSQKNYKGQFVDLAPGTHPVRSIPFVIKSCFIPNGDSWELEIEGASPGSIIKKTFNFSVGNLNGVVQGSNTPSNVGKDILSIEVIR